MPDPRSSDAEQTGQQVAPAGTATSAEAAATEVPKQGRQPKRPLGSYQLFLDHNRDSLLKQVPEGVNPIVFTGKKAGAMWRALSATEKAPFEQRAAELASEYKAAVEAFKANEKDVEETAIAATVDAKGTELTATGNSQRVPQDKSRPIKVCSGCYGPGVFVKLNGAKKKSVCQMGRMS